jgi:hypothetical protein
VALQHPETREFLRVSGLAPLWQSVDVRVLAVRNGGKWFNLMTRCYLDSRKTSDVTRLPDLPVEEDIGCWQVVKPANALEGILEEVEKGEFTLADRTVGYLRLPQPGAGTPSPYLFNRGLFSDLTSPQHYRIYPHWSCLWLSAYGYSIYEPINAIAGGQTAIDNILRTLPRPFDGLDGIASFVIGLPEPLRSDRSASFEGVAPFEGRMVNGRCQFEQGTVSVEIEAGSQIAAQRCTLGAFGVGKSPLPFRGSFALPEPRWDATAQRWLINHEFEVPSTQVLTLFLGLSGYNVDRATFVDAGRPVSNVRINTYALVDHDLAVFWRWLAGEGTDRAHDFERAVARLLTFIGFQVDLLADVPQLSEGIDLIAHSSPSRICLLVECTTGSLGTQGKPGKLILRLGAAKEAVRETEFLAVLVTSSKRSHLSQGELGAVSQDEIAVLCQEDLLELWKLAATGAQVAQALDYIKGRIGGEQAGASDS